MIDIGKVINLVFASLITFYAFRLWRCYRYWIDFWAGAVGLMWVVVYVYIMVMSPGPDVYYQMSVTYTRWLITASLIVLGAYVADRGRECKK